MPQDRAGNPSLSAVFKQLKSQGQKFVVVWHPWELSAWMTTVACVPLVHHGCLGATGMFHFILVAACLSLLQNKIRHVSWLWIFVSVKTSDVKKVIKDSWGLAYQDIGEIYLLLWFFGVPGYKKKYYKCWQEKNGKVWVKIYIYIYVLSLTILSVIKNSLGIWDFYFFFNFFVHQHVKF